MKAYFRENPSPGAFGNLTLGMFSDTDRPFATFPRLKGTASEIRALGPALLAAWNHYMDMSNEQNKQVKVALQCSIAMDRVLDAHPPREPILSADGAATFVRASWTFLALFTALARHFVFDHGRKLFNVTIKAHMLAHLALRAAEGLNPRTAWCFMGEDYMAHMRRLAQSCARGTGETKLSLKMLAKYRWGLHFTLQPVGKVWRR